MRCNALSILVVEPESAIANSLCSALERRGHRTLLATDPVGALESETPDVLICGVEAGGGGEGTPGGGAFPPWEEDVLPSQSRPCPPSGEPNAAPDAAQTDQHETPRAGRLFLF